MEYSFLIFPQVSTIIAALSAIIFVLYYLSPKYYTKNINEAPEAGGAWPIIGHLHLLRGSKLPHIVFGSLADKYGPIFTVRFGFRRAVVVSSWEVVKELFTGPSDVNVSGRPKFLGADLMSYDYAMFGFSPYNPMWVELRKIISAHLLSARRLELLKHVRVAEMETSMKQLYKLWVERENGSGRVLVTDMKEWFGELDFNVLSRMIVGKRYSGSGDSDDVVAKRCRRMNREFFRLMGSMVAADSLPFLRWLDLGGYEKAMKQTAEEMDSIASAWLEEHKSKRRNLLSGGEADQLEQDFMDVMFSAVENLDLGGFDVDTVIKATCMVCVLLTSSILVRVRFMCQQMCHILFDRSTLTTFIINLTIRTCIN